jgi:hypothetical protein
MTVNYRSILTLQRVGLKLLQLITSVNKRGILITFCDQLMTCHQSKCRLKSEQRET